MAIDRATRFGYVEGRYALKRLAARGFIERFLARFPLKARGRLTDNGMARTDRCHHTVKAQPAGRHPAGRLCKARHIAHRLTRPRTPRPHGLAEPFNRRLNEAIARKTRPQDNHGKHRLHAHQARNRLITRFVRHSNRNRLQCLNYQAPELCLDSMPNSTRKPA